MSPHLGEGVFFLVFKVTLIYCEGILSCPSVQHGEVRKQLSGVGTLFPNFVESGSLNFCCALHPTLASQELPFESLVSPSLLIVGGL